jgi:predicted RNA methylase
MGKRSDFERRPKDKYMTPLAAVAPLAPHLPANFTFIEPCAGDGRFRSHIETLCPGAYCEAAFDIDPDAAHIATRDALTLTPDDFGFVDFIITNPPWSRDKKSGYLLHKLIETCIEIAPTWFLFDSDWMHTTQARPYVEPYLEKVISIGRVKWIEGSTMTGKDNCCWYLFAKDARSRQPLPVFYGRHIVPAM